MKTITVYRELLGEEILRLPMSTAAAALTIGEYLIEILHLVWMENDNFSGKHPFGNSDWQWEVYEALVAGGAVAGGSTEDGIYGPDWDTTEADEAVTMAIDSLRQSYATTEEIVEHLIPYTIAGIQEDVIPELTRLVIAEIDKTRND